MRSSFIGTIAFVGMLICAQPAMSQSTGPAPAPSEESLTAARELVKSMNLNSLLGAVLPNLIQAMKPAIVQNRPEVARDFDAIVPTMIEMFQARANELSEAYVVIYTRNFTASELNDIAAFYRTETGQKLLAKMPALANESMVAGQKVGQAIAADLQQRMINELRKKGHNISVVANSKSVSRTDARLLIADSEAAHDRAHHHNHCQPVAGIDCSQGILAADKGVVDHHGGEHEAKPQEQA